MIKDKISKLKQDMTASHSPFLDDLIRIEEDFQRMSEFYAMGNLDPQLDQIYEKLTKRIAKLEKNDAIVRLSHTNPFYQRMLADTAGDYTLDLEQLRTQLEDFNVDITMLDLEDDENVKAEKRRGIFRNHHETMKKVFAKVCLSPVIGGSFADEISEIILSSTTSIIDAQLIVSALLISCLGVFDPCKADILYNVYTQTEDETLRQKALVAFVLSASVADDSYDLSERKLKPSLVANIQRQIFYMKDSPRVEAIMKNEIMPDVIKNSEFDFKNNKIIKKDRDKLDDILNPHHDEEMIEKMEETMKRMKTMQDQGSDIFFSGFKHIKQNPFFNIAMNWLCPFYLDHPQLPRIDNETDNSILRKLIVRTPFCESDKYSFMLSMNQALATIPDDMKQMIIQGEAQLDIVGGDITRNSAYIRRTYMQDLYRFFTLCYQAKSLNNPFDAKSNGGIVIKSFLNSRIPEYDDQAVSLCKTLRKLGMKAELDAFLQIWNPTAPTGKIYKAFCLLEAGNTQSALTLFDGVLADDPHNMQALFGLTKAAFQVFVTQPEWFSRHKENALNTLLALYFKNEKDMSVQHTLIKAHLMAGETAKALQLGEALVAEGKAESFVLSFVGLNHVLQGDIVGGIKLLRKSGENLTKVFNLAGKCGLEIPLSQQNLLQNILSN